MIVKYYIIGTVVIALITIAIGYSVEYARLKAVENNVIIETKASRVILNTFEAVKKQKLKDLHEKINNGYIPTCDSNCTHSL